MATKKTETEAIASLVDNFDFILVGMQSKFPFRSYISSIDPTSAEPGVLIQGSQNTYKTLRGSLAVRPGLKLRGNVDATLAGVKSSYEWETSNGVTRVLRVDNGKFQVEFDAGDGAGLVWRDILTGLTLTRFVFDPWWDDTNKKDRLLFAIGDQNLRMWSGGVGKVASATSSTITLSGTQSAKQQGFDAGLNSVLIAGTTYTYTAAGLSGSNAFSDSSTNHKYALNSTGATYISQLFTTGATATQILSAQAKFNLSTMETGFTNIFIATLYTDNAGVPGTVLTSVQGVQGSSDTTSGAGDYTVNFSFGNGVAVASVTNYHLSITQQSGSTGWSAYYGNSSGVGTNNSTDNVNWSAQNGPLNLVVVENDVSTQTLVGVTPNPSAVPVGSVVIQKVVVQTNVPDPTFTLDFLKVIGNQVHCGSYESHYIYVGRSTNYFDFTIPAVRAPGDPDLLTLDSLARGITVQKDKNGQNTIAVISGGLGDWYTVGRAPLNVGTGTSVTPTEQVSVTKSEVADLATALAHEFITNVGDNILFLDQNNQLREFGTVRNIVNPVFPTLSLDVFDELKALNFTGGHLRAVADQGGEIVYLVCPLSGVDYMYQIRQTLDTVGNLHAERIWQPPMVRGLSRIALINGVTYGHSNANPQLYQLWDTNQYHDDSPSGQPLPYESHSFMCYLNVGKGSLLFFDKIYFEGYMTTGSVVGCNIYQEYQGAKNIPFVTINNPQKGQKSAKFYTGLTDVSEGQNSLGNNPLGDGLTLPGGAQALVPKFRAIRAATAAYLFEYALDVFSNTADAQWELLTLGANHMPAPSRPIAIIN